MAKYFHFALLSLLFVIFLIVTITSAISGNGLPFLIGLISIFPLSAYSVKKLEQYYGW